MNSPSLVQVTMPQQPGGPSGVVESVWHAVDGVRVAVTFPAEGAPLMAIGRAGELVFRREGLDESVLALGKVAFRGDQGEQRRYHFLFGERTRQNLAHLLEPRRTHRVHPEEDEPVEVSLVVDEESQQVIIASARDVSSTGLGVDVPWEFETRLSALERLRVLVRLPGNDEQLDFTGRVCNRALGRGAICYGMEFEGDSASGPEGFEALSAFVDSLGKGQDRRFRRSA